VAARDEPPELIVVDATAWRDWLADSHTDPTGVWLVLAKKGTTEPTSLTYAEALDEALCFGWIDGTKQRRDDATFRQRFTPRRQRSTWSMRNVSHVDRLESEGRMRRAGRREVERAKADGRWDAAYAGQARMEVPDNLAAALAADPHAAEMFERLSSSNRYAILYRLADAKRPETRQRRLDTFVAMLARGETIHPQRPDR
jgi:uncharacterized protein YdeI (YjbR/CyaY-like superfamily)